MLDVNDNQPKFEVDSYNVSVYENVPNGYNVLRVVAMDLDQGENGEFVYHLVDPSQAFTIDGKTGWITVRNHTKLDREQKSSFSLRVYARERIPFVMQQKEMGSVLFMCARVFFPLSSAENPRLNTIPSSILFYFFFSLIFF